MCEPRCCSGETIICWAVHCGLVLVGQQISLHQIDPNDCYILARLLSIQTINYVVTTIKTIWPELGNFLNWYHPSSLQLLVIKRLLSWWLTQFCPKFSTRQPDPQGETQSKAFFLILYFGLVFWIWYFVLRIWCFLAKFSSQQPDPHGETQSKAFFNFVFWTCILDLVFCIVYLMFLVKFSPQHAQGETQSTFPAFLYFVFWLVF